MIDIKKLWDLLYKDEWGLEPIAIKVDKNKDEIKMEICTVYPRQDIEDKLYVKGTGKTFEEAFRNFELNLDNCFLD